MTRKPIPFRRPRPAVDAAQDHTFDAVLYSGERTADSLRLAQFHLREADRLIELYRGNRAA